MKHVVAVCLSILLGVPSARAVETAGDTAIEIKITDEVEVKVKTADGKEELRRMPAEKVAPGTSVIYTLSAKNTSAAPVADVVMTDPIPAEMEYVDGSVTAENAQVTFSVDGGKTFAAQSALQVRGEDGAMRPARAADFTHIRWQLRKPLGPGEVYAASFKARVE